MSSRGLHLSFFPSELSLSIIFRDQWVINLTPVGLMANVQAAKRVVTHLFSQNNELSPTSDMTTSLL